ncbi:3-hydroxybutyrate dehydrogenase [Metabacillus halosaccharovorans]|uniref:3-hydroxybutyrate dehydrogenase n=1 Tax=Metabacillus halosaccharovorans TaxID=930124 RepID=A0ABT3DPD3_9BACI|nr:3-hydroxybutyrate dehydrogenase [Metabacillus halosaccharovorans]MCV9888926.1 3-hydroxybutyrate dehydrogenase [Metabacillus halosaccharovorans]
MVLAQVVLLTGAARGIGFELAKAFAKEGAKVVLTDLHEEQVRASTKRLQEEGLDVSGLSCDVTNEQNIIDVVKETAARYGRIDTLINNAGLQHVAHIEDFPTEKFEQLVSVMLVAPFVLTKHVFPFMKNQQFGRVLNIASINGLIGFAGKAAYNSAKHGVIGLTKVAALEGAPYGITVNALCPGYVDTPLVRNQLQDLANTRKIPLENVLEDVLYPLIPQKRLLDPKEVADYAIFLASEKAKGVTGQAVVLDGGYTVQ